MENKIAKSTNVEQNVSFCRGNNIKLHLIAGGGIPVFPFNDMQLLLRVDIDGHSLKNPLWWHQVSVPRSKVRGFLR
jgi:hypothetical protein